MNDEDPAGKAKLSALARGVRLDLVIAVCALLISSVAAGASWWQARVLVVQTNVLQQQLGAQVWPYVSFSSSFSDDSVRLILANDGLGPAILRSETLTFDGKPQRGFIAMLHSILGPHVARHYHVGIDVSDDAPGNVLRPGDTHTMFKLTNKELAPRLARASEHIDMQLCYCAIIPGKCWRTTSGTDPQPVAACPEIAHDLLHETTFSDLLKRAF